MHSETYDFKTIESKWQWFWQSQSSESGVRSSENTIKAVDSNFQLSTPNSQLKFYCLVMFPYPSGKIHMGHARNYCIGDVIARYKRMKGFKVMHPIGWDAFGLPAENAAIEHGVNPQKWTEQNIRDMRQDIQSLGISYDWEREIATCHPDYYRWNQWFFIQMFKKGLAIRKKSAVNWCSKCQTVLANEQVHDGKCWRCDTEVTQKDLDQWFLKISDYAERLLEDLKLLEGKWPDEVLLMQKNWIGKSVGAEVDFEIAESSELPLREASLRVESLETKKEKNSTPQLTTHNSQLTTTIKVFTTRPDTLFGCTFMVLAPEHPLVNQLLVTSNQSQVKEYCETAKRKSKIDRTSADREKTGVFTGLYALNPVNDKKIPIWVADYVLSDYGTGAIMAVPAHDQRDFEFAKKYDLPIVEVIQPAKRSELRVESLEIKHKTKSTESNSQLPTPNSQLKEAYEGEGIMINSGKFSGMNSEEAKRKIPERLQTQNKGHESVTYRIRDWLISRQRYWGTPIPIIYCAKCGMVPVPEKELPVLLPKNVRFTGKGESPLAQIESFVQVKCHQCRCEARRETDTMDTFVDSSWYYLRYCDAKNQSAPFDSKIANDWMPVNQYIGGIEHACMHLIYSRFFHKVLHDLKIVESAEPFERLLTQGMVTLGGSAMSKSKGNIVAVEEMVKEYGADTARTFILFAAPPKNQLEWSDEGVQGIWRFLNRIWRLSEKIKNSKPKTNAEITVPEQLVKSLPKKLERKTHWAIKKVQEDIEREFQFNTAIAALMELLNELSEYPEEMKGDDTFRKAFRTLLILLFPFAPHLSSDIWENLSYQPKSMEEIRYPAYDPEILKESRVEIVIQLNGKLKAKFSLPAEESKEEASAVREARKVLSEKGFKEELENYKFVPGRLINFIATRQVEAKR